MKKFLIIACCLLATILIAATFKFEKRQAVLHKVNEKLIIQNDSLLAEKRSYEKKFLQLLQQFDTIINKKNLDSTITFIPKKGKGKKMSS